MKYKVLETTPEITKIKTQTMDSPEQATANDQNEVSKSEWQNLGTELPDGPSDEQEVFIPEAERAGTDGQEPQQAFAEVVGQHELSTGKRLDILENEASYPVLDLSETEPGRTLDLLESFERTDEYVWHGMHMSEFHEEAELELGWFDALDPTHSHQEEGRKAVYATDNVRAGLVHAVLKHRKQDMDPDTGETYGIALQAKQREGRIIAASSALRESLYEGTAEFAEGWLFALPKNRFESIKDSDHEVVAKEPVEPVFGIKVGAGLGPKVVNPETLTRGIDMDEQDNEKETTNNEGIAELSENFANVLNKANIEVDSKKVREVFDTPGVYDLRTDQVLDRLGIDQHGISEEAKQQLIDEGLVSVFDRLVARNLRRDLDNTDLEKYTAEENITVKSGRENLSAQEASEVLDSVLTDTNAEFHQGYHWNVLLSEHSDYAVKFIKNNDKSFESAQSEINDYQDIENTIGEEFLLPQTVIELANTRRQVMLQQKLDLEQWQPVSAYRGTPSELTQSLHDPANREQLDDFLGGIARLEEEQGLVIDLAGENAYSRIDENGHLEIKLIDYGCLEADNPYHQQGVQKSKDFAAKLAG